MKVTWTTPSNIALVKYWGKFGVQLPKNPSISFTLKQSTTTLSLTSQKKVISDKTIALEFFFEGQKNDKFMKKIGHFLETQINRFPWLLDYSLEIHSSNTFPHSSGIASSASSMSALSLCLMSSDELITNKFLSEEQFLKSASELARLASGSASRSVYPGLAFWGEISDLPESSNFHAGAFLGAHEIFNNYCDSILIVDAGEKSVSSRAGHGLMENHPFKEQRFLKARENLSRLMSALKTGDMPTFIEVVEEEALMLHALMMTSSPSYILLKPESLWLINKIQSYRAEKNIPVCFTIDAGPNIHLLYPKNCDAMVKDWIEHELAHELPKLQWIHDEVGNGPKCLEAIRDDQFHES